MIYTVTLTDQQGNTVMQSTHGYRPYAMTKAETWKRLYPQYTVTISPSNQEG